MSVASDTARDLTQNIEALGASILGPHNRTLSTRRQHRWGAKGSIAVEVAGPKRGSWFDHEAGVGGDALDLVCYARRCDMRDAMEWARAWLGTAEPAIAAPIVSVKPPEPDGNRDGLVLAERIWTEARGAAGTPVERYLSGRGLRLPTASTLRFHPACPRGGDRLSAMIGLMTAPVSGKPTGVHRTFLRPDGSGKAAVSPNKMMLGPAGVVRLADDPEMSLGIAEGIETALTVQQHFWAGPVWACCSASGIARLPVIPGIQALSIFADADEAGLNAARACAGNWFKGEVSEIRIIRPKLGGDWNGAITGASS